MHLIAEAETRIDLFVAKNAGISRSLSNSLVEQGKVSVNDTVVTKTSTKLKPDDVVTIDFELAKQTAIPDIALPILYEDADCIVVEKPAGLLTHSKGAFNPEATVATFVASKLHDLDGARGGIVHRLDRITSGVMICAKTPEAMSWLQKQFSERKTTKTYLAIVEGRPDPTEAIIDMPIERNPKKPQTFRVGANGKPAQTSYRILESNNTHSLVELQPKTGRTHQLRVHMSYLKHPILGDVLYGAKPGKRVYLHARSLEITLPSKERKVFTSDLPKSFNEMVHTI